MKKLLPVLILLLTFTSLHCISKKELSFTSEKYNFGLTVPADWNVYTMADTAPDFYKDQLSHKTSVDDIPLFIGLDKTQNNGIRCIAEEYTSTLADYMELFKNLCATSNITIQTLDYINPNECVVTYEAANGTLTFKFMEYMIINNSTVVRLTFWTLNNLFDKYFPAYKDISAKVYFNENNNWVSKSNGLDSFAFNSAQTSKKDKKKPNTSPYVFYTVKGEKNTVYLMGSIHVGSDDFFPFSDKIESSFAKSPNLVVEVNTEAGNTKEVISQLALIENNKTLDAVISPELYKKSGDILKSFGYDINNVKQYKPWMVAAIITVLKYTSLGYIAESGTDKYFLQKGKDKKIHELESAEFQGNLFNNIDGETFLSYSLLDIANADKHINEMIAAWKKGDEKKLDAIIFDKSLSKNITDIEKLIYEELFYKRNVQMTEKIKTYANDTEDYFVVVGAGHLIGNKSIVKLLKDAGYNITKNK